MKKFLQPVRPETMLDHSVDYDFLPNINKSSQVSTKSINKTELPAQISYKKYKKISSVKQNWNFGPEVKNCKTVKYITEYITKKIPIKIKYNKDFHRFQPRSKR